MIKHLGHNHKEIYQNFLLNKKNSGNNNEKDNHFQIKSNDLLSKVFFQNNIPFTVLENKYFKDFISFLNPNFDLPSSQTLTDKLIPEKFLETKLKIKKILESIESVNLDLDIWSNKTGFSFLSINIHFIDQNFELNNFLLDLVPLEKDHNSKNLYNYVISCINDFGMSSEKIFCIITDNSKNIIKKGPDFFFHFFDIFFLLNY